MRLEALALPASALLGNLQLFSLLLSIGCLGLAVGMARLLFAKTERMEAALFLSILAVFPGLVFVSSRLTNDVLLTFLAFLFFYLLLRWWKTGNGKEWYVVVLTAAAAVLTKTSGAIFIALAFLSLFLRPKQERKRMLRTAVLSLGLLILLTGWLPVLRYGIEHDRTRSIVLGNQGMSPDTVVPTNVNTFLVFNPLDVLHIPYNNPTGTAERKEFFWEYFYRSAFFGEFNFNDSFKTISFLLLFFGLLSLPAIACGIADDIAHKRPLMLPVLLTAAALLAGSIAYRLFFAYAPDQDFRFVTLLLAPLSYYAVRGASSLPAGWRRFFTWSLWALVFCAALFFLKLYFSQ
jgi:4-amino-4-deoxy-L-arabinose transferase-like glycosyltransferase